MTSPTPPRVTVIIVADGPWDDTYRCLSAVVRGAAGLAYEVIVVDDGTTDETDRALQHLDGITAMRSDHRQGFRPAATAGLQVATAPLALLLHADAEPHPGWLEPLVTLAEADPAVVAVSSRLLAPSGLVESDGTVFAFAAPYPMTPVAFGAGEPGVPSGEVSQVPAAPAVSLLLRREAVAAVGGFDTGFEGPAADLDLCLRLGAQGGVVLVAAASVAIHHGRCSPDISDADAARLTTRWLGRVPLLDPSGRAALPPPGPVAGRGPVSVVIPMSNGLATIAPCALSVLRNLGAGDELVLADAGSTDGTLEFARLLEREYPGRVKLTEAADAPGALRRGLATALRGDALVVPQTLELPEGFLAQLSTLRAGPAGHAAVAVARAGSPLCLLAPASLLRALAASKAGACLGSDPVPLDAAVRAAGATLGVVVLDEVAAAA
jgi:GT2 family glycosyltransferase